MTHRNDVIRYHYCDTEAGAVVSIRELCPAGSLRDVICGVKEGAGTKLDFPKKYAAGAAASGSGLPAGDVKVRKVNLCFRERERENADHWWYPRPLCVWARARACVCARACGCTGGTEHPIGALSRR